MLVRVIGQPLGKYAVGDLFGSPPGEANVLLLLGRVERGDTTAVHAEQLQDPDVTAVTPVPPKPMQAYAGKKRGRKAKGFRAESHAGSGEQPESYQRRDVTDPNLETK